MATLAIRTFYQYHIELLINAAQKRLGISCKYENWTRTAPVVHVASECFLSVPSGLYTYRTRSEEQYLHLYQIGAINSIFIEAPFLKKILASCIMKMMGMVYARNIMTKET